MEKIKHTQKWFLRQMVKHTESKINVVDTDCKKARLYIIKSLILAKLDHTEEEIAEVLEEGFKHCRLFNYKQ